MFFTQTLNELNEEELSILFLICQKYLEPLGIQATFNFVKMLKKDITFRIIDVLKSQALEEKKEVFDSLKKKLQE
jgi:hypothetical protein